MKTLLHAGYNGSKGRQVGLILDVLGRNVDIKNVTTACDPFSGRAHVSYAFKQLGWAVTACDRLASAAGWAKWVIESTVAPLDEDTLRMLLGPATQPAPTFVEDNFYLVHRGAIPKISLENARLAQNFLANSARLSEHHRTLARALLAVTVYDCLPYSNENHAHPERNIYDLGKKLLLRLRDINSCIVPGQRPCRALWANAVAHLASSEYDLSYIDPPYVVARRVYECQLVESLAEGRLVHREELPNAFDNKKTARRALRELFEAADRAARIWVVSYNTTSHLGVRELGQMMTPHRMVQVYAFPHRMAVGTKQQSANRSGDTKAVILLGLPYPKRFRHFARHAKQYQEDGELTAGVGEWHTCLLPRQVVAADGRHQTDLPPTPPSTRHMNRRVIIETVAPIGLDERRLMETAAKIREEVKAGRDSGFEAKQERQRYRERMRSAFKKEPTGILAALRSKDASYRHSALLEALERPGSYEQHCGRELLEALRFVVMNPLPDAPSPYRAGETIYVQLAGEDRLLAAICLAEIATTNALAVLEECQRGDSGLGAVIQEWQGSIGTTGIDRKTFSADPMAPVEQSVPTGAPTL